MVRESFRSVPFSIQGPLGQTLPRQGEFVRAALRARNGAARETLRGVDIFARAELNFDCSMRANCFVCF